MRNPFDWRCTLICAPCAPQAQDNTELVKNNDRVNNDWIMDAVTHQPLGKQAAMKGTDNVFYWDLNVKPAVTPGGATR